MSHQDRRDPLPASYQFPARQSCAPRLATVHLPHVYTQMPSGSYSFSANGQQWVVDFGVTPLRTRQVQQSADATGEP